MYNSLSDTLRSRVILPQSILASSIIIHKIRACSDAQFFADLKQLHIEEQKKQK